MNSCEAAPRKLQYVERFVLFRITGQKGIVRRINSPNLLLKKQRGSQRKARVCEKVESSVWKEERKNY